MERVTIDLDEDAYEALRRDAEAHGRSVEAEAATRLRSPSKGGERWYSSEAERGRLLARVREIRASSRVPQRTDSVELLREDRDREH